MPSPDQPDAAEIVKLATLPLWQLSLRLDRLTVENREQFFDALQGDAALHRRANLALRVRASQPNAISKCIARDVAFLLACCPAPDPEHEDMLLQYLAGPHESDPHMVKWKAVYADFLEDRGDRLMGAIRAEVGAVAAGMSAKQVCGVLEALRHLGITHTHAELDTLGTMPFSPETLAKYKDTHVLVAGAPLSLNQIINLAPDDFSYPSAHYSETWANENRVGVRWHLLRKEPVPDSVGKIYSQQVALLTNAEEVPLAAELTYADILCRRTHGKHILQVNRALRCQDTSWGARQIIVCKFGSSNRFSYCFDEDDSGRSYLGLASSVLPRKS